MDEPEWGLLGLDGIDKLPALQWKFANVRKMPVQSHAAAVDRLASVLKF